MRRWDITVKKQMKTMLKVVACALLCNVAFVSCAAKKPVVKQEQQQAVPQKSEKERLLDSLRLESEIRRVQKEMDLRDAQMDAELQTALLQSQNAQRAIAARLGQKLYIPCIEESYDNPSEYMAGLGIAEGYTEQGPAKIDANRYAISDIASRYIGVIKNAVSQYSNNITTRNGQKGKENQLEGLAESVGQKAVEKYANAVCTEFAHADNGTFTCYVVVHVPLKNIIDEAIDELGAAQVEFDRHKMRQYMEKELNQQAAAKAEEKAQIEKMKKDMAL